MAAATEISDAPSPVVLDGFGGSEELRLSDEVCGIIEAHASELNALEGSEGTRETEVIRAGLCRVLSHILRWEPVDFMSSEGRIGALETGLICLETSWLAGATSGAMQPDELFVDLIEWYASISDLDGDGTIQPAEDLDGDGTIEPAEDNRDIAGTSEPAADPGGIASVMLRMVRRHATVLDRRQEEERNGSGSCYASVVARMVRAVSCRNTAHLSCSDVDSLRELPGPVAVVAFAFGTGSKVGDGVQMPTLVGPGHELPGSTNCGLAMTIRTILDARPVVAVQAQWEVADALLHGPEGSPEAQSFADWRFGEFSIDGGGHGGSDGGGLYRLHEWAAATTTDPHAVSNPLCGWRLSRPMQPGEAIHLYKAVPTWPRAVRAGEIEVMDMRVPSIAWRYYLGSPDVVRQMQGRWSESDGHGDQRDDDAPCGLSPTSQSASLPPPPPPLPRSFVLVGHPDHVHRCLYLCDALPGTRERTVRLAGGSLLPDAGEWAACGCDAFGYDPRSSQPWTRNRAVFLVREMIVRCGDVLSEVYRAEPTESGHTLRFTAG